MGFLREVSCRTCETINQAPVPSLPIRLGRAGPGLLAHVLVSKYADHLPLYRQAEILARDGIELNRSTLADRVGQCAALLWPLIDALARHALGGAVLHADDTPVPVLAPGMGRTRTGRLWAYVRDERPCGGKAAPSASYCSNGQTIPAAAARLRYSRTVLGAMPSSCAMDRALAPAQKRIVSNCLIRRMDSLCLGIPPLHRLRWRHWKPGHR